MKKRRIIVNNDFYNIFQVNPPVTDQDIHNAVDKMVFPGSQVDTLFLMVDEGLNGMIAPELVRLYDHPSVDPCVNSLQHAKAAGKDPFGMVLKRARAKGLEFFGSVRMNDTHYKDHVYHPWMDQFYYDNLHNRVSASGAMDGQRVNTEFDYRKSAVRQYYFDMIRRCVERYDVDGMELDLTRNCRFFPDPNREECAPVMTEFVRQVRQLLDQVGKKRKKRIQLAVTVPYSLYRARLEGLDVPTWARLGLVDILCLSTPFLVDTGRDIHDTKLKVPGVQVFAGCDRNFQWPGRPFPCEAYRAMAMDALRQGADGFYAYNVMHWTIRLEDPTEELKLFGGGSWAVHDACLMREIGQISTLERLDKLYLASQGSESADKPYANLPVKVPAGGEVTVRVSVGDDIAQAAAEDALDALYVQTVSSDCAEYNNYTLKLNGIDLARQYAFMPYALKPENALLFPEPERNPASIPAVEKVRRHKVRAIDLHTGVNFITIKSYRDPMTITDVEVGIVYRKE